MRSFCFGLVCSLGRPAAAAAAAAPPPSPAAQRDVVLSWIRGANRFLSCNVLYRTAFYQVVWSGLVWFMFVLVCLLVVMV